jgi:hypothetical protein
VNPRARAPANEAWFAAYGASVGAAVVSVADPELVREFSSLVGPLESLAGRPLGEPGRQKCLTAFCESPDGFRRLVADAERRGKTNPIGLLLTMVAAGEHREVAT